MAKWQELRVHFDDDCNGEITLEEVSIGCCSDVDTESVHLIFSGILVIEWIVSFLTVC